MLVIVSGQLYSQRSDYLSLLVRRCAIQRSPQSAPRHPRQSFAAVAGLALGGCLHAVIALLSRIC